MNKMDEELENILMAFEGEAFGLTLDAIRQRYKHTSNATVARRQKKARDAGHVQKKVLLNIPDKYKDSFLNYITYVPMEQRLLKVLREEHGSKLDRLTVVPAIRNTTDAGEEPHPDDEADFPTRTAVAFHTAGWLARDILKIRNETKKPVIHIGLNYGYMVHKVCMHLRHNWSEDELAGTSVRLSGLTGVHSIDPQGNETLAKKAWEVSSIANCGVLAPTFKASPPIIDRINVPAQLTDPGKDGFSEDEKALLKNYLLSADPAYSFLFGDKPVFPTWDEIKTYRARRKNQKNYECGHFLDLDIIVTGLSALEPSAGFRAYSSPELQKKLQKLQDEKPVAGEVASHVFMADGCIPRRDHPKWGNVIGTLNSLRVGLCPEDLMDVAEKNQKRKLGAGGVLMCCTGKLKAEPLFTVLTTMNLVNHAIIDSDIAEIFYTKLGLIKHFKEDREERDMVIRQLKI